MQELAKLDGNYRFLIPSDEEGIVIGTPASVNNPNHQEVAESLGFDLEKVKGGYAVIFNDGQNFEYTGGSYSVPEASEEEFEAAKKRSVTVYQAE